MDYTYQPTISGDTVLELRDGTTIGYEYVGSGFISVLIHGSDGILESRITKDYIWRKCSVSRASEEYIENIISQMSEFDEQDEVMLNFQEVLEGGLRELGNKLAIRKSQLTDEIVKLFNREEAVETVTECKAWSREVGEVIAKMIETHKGPIELESKDRLIRTIVYVTQAESDQKIFRLYNHLGVKLLVSYYGAVPAIVE